jgi:hypothetical protein
VILLEEICVSLSPEFDDRFKKILAKDRPLSERIVFRVEKIRKQIMCSLKHHHHIPICRTGQYVGDYVILYRVENNIMLLDALMHRDEL